MESSLEEKGQTNFTIFDQFDNLEMNKIDLGTTEFLRLVELLEVENPSFQQTENVLIQAEHHTANDKLKLYVKLGENELLRLESEGFEISEDKEMFQRVIQSVSLANEHSLKEYGFGYYHLSPQIQDEYLEDLINDQLIEYRSSCTVENIPIGLFGVSSKRYYSAYKKSNVKNDSGECVCDNKI